MVDPVVPIAELLRQDKRYKFEAYGFVFEALKYAHTVLGLGSEQPSEAVADAEEDAEEGAGGERHLTGQELCEAIRRYALDQYGLLAKCVLNSWGVHTTSDFGEIVYNLIQIKHMRKTAGDRREDFDDVFDFETGLRQSFQIKPPD